MAVKNQKSKIKNQNLIRQSKFAGSFYPKDRNGLDLMLADFFANADKELARTIKDADFKNKEIKALISPHAGYVYSGQVAAFGYKLLELFPPKSKDFLILGPSHQVFIKEPYADANDYWATPLGKVKINRGLIKKIGVKENSEAHDEEHSIEVQLPFLQRIFSDLSVAPIAVNEENGILTSGILNIISETTIIVSSDLSHFLTYKEAVEIDKKTINAILELDKNKLLKIGENSACGLAGILMIMEIAKKLNWQPHLLKYLNSGDTAGDKSRVVGYASIVFANFV